MCVVYLSAYRMRSFVTAGRKNQCFSRFSLFIAFELMCVPSTVNVRSLLVSAIKMIHDFSLTTRFDAIATVWQLNCRSKST